MLKAAHVHVIPAEPGHRLVMEEDDKKRVWISDLVIAWRIDSFLDNGGNLFSTTTAITVDGDAAANACAVVHPDGTVTVFEDSTYDSFESFAAARAAD